MDRDVFFVQIGGFDNHQSLERKPLGMKPGEL